MVKTIVIENIPSLIAFAQSISEQISLGSLLTLTGPLGVGKTTFTQALAKALQVQENVISPTFTVMKIYRLPKGRLLHIDAFRLAGKDDVGLWEEMGDDTITVIEWPERLMPLPRVKQHLHLSFAFNSDTSRTITMTTMPQQ